MNASGRLYDTALVPRLHGPPADVARALQALRGVVDPQVGENIVELGLIEALRVDADSAELLLTTPSAYCPLSDFSADAALRALQRALPERDLFVRHDADLLWCPAHMSRAARQRLHWLAGLGH